MKRSIVVSALLFPAQLSLVLVLGACSEKPQNAFAPLPTRPPAEPAHTMEKGMYFKPELSEFALHNEYNDDGDGDGVKETHVRRYINRKGDTVFSMTTGDRLWAWSLDTRGSDDNDLRKNYVIRDSNCDGVFDERYSLSAEFRVPGCLSQEGANETRKGVSNS